MLRNAPKCLEMHEKTHGFDRGENKIENKNYFVK